MKKTVIFLLLSVLVLSGCAAPIAQPPAEAPHPVPSSSLSETGSPQAFSGDPWPLIEVTPEKIADVFGNSDGQLGVLTESGALYMWGGSDGVGGEVWEQCGGGIGKYKYGGLRQADAGRWSMVYVDAEATLWHCPHYSDEPIKLAENVKTAFRNHYSGIVLFEDGSVWTWGSSEYGQLGDGSQVAFGERKFIDDVPFEPKKIMENVREISNFGTTYYAIKEDGSLWRWGLIGFDENGEPVCMTVPEYFLSDVSQVSGSTSGFAVKEDGSLWTWGSKVTGNEKEAPRKIMDNVRWATANWCFAVIKEDNSLWAWENKPDDGTDIAKDTPFKLMDNVADLADGYLSLVILSESNELWEVPTNNDAVFKAGCEPYKILQELWKI